MSETTDLKEAVEALTDSVDGLTARCGELFDRSLEMGDQNRSTTADLKDQNRGLIRVLRELKDAIYNKL